MLLPRQSVVFLLTSQMAGVIYRSLMSSSVIRCLSRIWLIGISSFPCMFCRDVYEMIPRKSIPHLGFYHKTRKAALTDDLKNQVLYWVISLKPWIPERKTGSFLIKPQTQNNG